MQVERITTDREVCLIAALAACGIKLNVHLSCMIWSMVDEIDSKGVKMSIDDIARIKANVDALFVNEKESSYNNK